jgi:hypothetical protein
MAFCRMCGTELDAGERYCHRCGTLVTTETIASLSLSISHSSLIKIWRRFSPIILFLALIVVASYLLGQSATHTDVTTALLDEGYRKMILLQLRDQPTTYYSIVDRLFRQLYSAQGPLFTNDFPLIFYIWLLAPEIEGVKWIYFIFALCGAVGSYFAVYAATRQGLVAFLSAVWIAYFLETEHLLMYENWAISVFLIGFAFFMLKRPLAAAVAIGIATLLKEVFAPFLVAASIYYLATSSKRWWPTIRYTMGSRFSSVTHEHLSRWRKAELQGDAQTKLALTWIVTTCSVIFLWALNGFVSTGGNVRLSHSPFTSNQWGVQLDVLPLLFSGGCCYLHVLPPLPAVVVVGLGLIGIAFLEKDQKVITYASLVAVPLLILLGIVGYGSPYRSDNVPRWDALSITLVNLLWLVGPYKICEYAYHRLQGFTIAATNTQTASGPDPLSSVDLPLFALQELTKA